MSSTFGEKSVLEVETAGNVVEAAAGIAVVVLSIIGLAHVGGASMTAVATIVLGAALLAQGGTVAAEYSKLLAMASGGTLGAVELGGGMSVEMLAGGAAVVLGILGLLGLSPEYLLPAAVIVVGASLILAAGALQRLNTLKVQAANLSDLAQSVARSAVAAALSAQVLAGGAAIVLGILGLTLPMSAPVLTLVGLLVLGGAVAISSTALAGRLFRLMNGK